MCAYGVAASWVATNLNIRAAYYLYAIGADAMTEDPIVDEVRRAGEEYFAKFNFDLTAICEDLRRRTEEAARDGHKIVSLPPRRPDPVFLAAKKVG